jgi:hypothetical protein
MGILNSGEHLAIESIRSTGRATTRSILQGMQSPVSPAPSPPGSFAGFLAALAQPDRAPVDRASAWDNELLAEDVATISYERALRAHGRYHADDPITRAGEAAPPAPLNVAAPSPEAVLTVPSAPERVIKEASITIRLSREEAAQLRKRAAEAGLTISAYIRSCTFEAEALCALVKDTLTQFRAAGPTPQQDPPTRRRWSALFWPGRRAAHTTTPGQA